jgi:hypothetical protein
LADEIENRGVLEDLVKQPKLIEKDYGIIHYDSPGQKRNRCGAVVSEKGPAHKLQQYSLYIL